MNIERAYPPEAKLKSWRRNVRLDRTKKEIEIRDRYALQQAVGDITLTLMTPCKPRVAAGELLLQPAGVKVLFDGATLHAVTEEIKLDDARLQKSWGDVLYRVLFKCDKPPLEADWWIRIVLA